MLTNEQSLAEWLQTLPTVAWALDCEITLNGRKFVAAQYATVVTAPAGSRAALEHRMPTAETRFYVLGDAPSHRSVVWNIAGERAFDWFVAGWADERTVRSPQFREYHPHGVWFGLHPWTADEPIDRYEDHPYKRRTMEVRYR